VSDLLKALVLGIIEGLSEFLPISSTGHLIVAMPLLGVDGDEPAWKAFLYFIQIGAILAVVIHFRRHLLVAALASPRGRWSDHLVTKLLVAMLPAAAIGLPLNKHVEAALEKPLPVAIALIVGAGLMVLIERRFRRERGPGIDQVSLRQALCIGLAQVVSIIPGTSRAMATILGGMIVGLPAPTAAQFSFYLAIPTLLGAGLMRLVKHRHAIGADQAAALAVGFVTSFVVAWLVVAGFMRYLQTRTLAPFAVYRILLGLVVIAWWATS
jgi:undecaprenyl-diphosphatase